MKVKNIDKVLEVSETINNMGFRAWSIDDMIGGIMGLILSFGISNLINQVAGGMGMPVQEISYIPLWLYLAGLGFSTFVGIVAGYYPAVKAMKLSVLDAIRSE